MDFELSDERRMLAETAERFLRDRYTIEVRHRAAASEHGFDRDLWREFAELGLVAALLPPEVEGLGGAGEDLMVTFEALGRGLVVEPFLATLAGTVPILRLGDEEDRALLGEVATGERLIAFAHGEPEGRYHPSHVGTRAERTDDGWRLTGTKAVVANGDAADTLLVSARVSGDVTDEEGLALFLLDAAAEGVERRGYGMVEGGHAAEIALDGALAKPLGEPGAAFPAIEEALARGAFALAAEAIGIMDYCRETTLDYLKTRTQFGKPIGANQALQHRMVDVWLEVEQARSAVMLAAAWLDAPGEKGRAGRERTVAAAKHLAGRVGRFVAEEAIQLHGGIAMTWDYPMAHYAKRLVMIDHLFGDADHHAVRYRQFA
ncbi:MAG: acyl-CoA dehydrogenase family protein [Paracoccaceae bacterium]